MPSSQAAHYRARATDHIQAVLGHLVLPASTALVAMGSFARGEATEYSDLDLMLLHTGPTPAGADELWYPIWDSGLRLDSSIRTPADCVTIVSTDISAALSLLDMRLVAGNEDLFVTTRTKVLEAWRRVVHKQFDQVVELAIERWRRSGSVSTMTAPDLKHGRGGLRDIEFVRALSLAQVASAPDLARDKQLLIDARTLLHHAFGRARDVLHPQFAADIADELGFPDRFALSAALATTGRRIDDAVHHVLAQARDVVKPARHTRTFGLGSILSGPIGQRGRTPLDVDVLADRGEIVLPHTANLDDPGLVLRVAAAAARSGLPVATATWETLASHRRSHAVELGTPWRASELADFFALLTSTSRSPSNSVVDIVNQLVEHELWVGIVPQWQRIVGLVPREHTHIYTVDQHILHTVSLAAGGITVSRPDLLALAALYHDIGKGLNRPHSEVGAEMVADQATRMGLNRSDREILRVTVREHTTLIRLATSQDPASDDTARQLLDAIGWERTTLDVLEALTLADSQATGPGVLTPGREQAVRTLAATARRLIPVSIPQPPEVELPAGFSTSDPSHPGYTISADGTIHFAVTDRARTQALVATIAAKNWRVEQARLGIQAGEITVHSRNRSEDFNNTEFVQAVKSGIYTAQAVPAPTTTEVNSARDLFTQWLSPTVLELHLPATDRAFPDVLLVLPDFEWLTWDTPGAVAIAIIGFPTAAVHATSPDTFHGQVARALGRLATSQIS